MDKSGHLTKGQRYKHRLLVFGILYSWLIDWLIGHLYTLFEVQILYNVKGMITNGEWAGIWIQADLDYLKTLYRYFPGGARNTSAMKSEPSRTDICGFYLPTASRPVSPP